jgi:RHS repeat-associated protein
MAENTTAGNEQENVSQEDGSPFAPPQIVLPKGGGAIRGIDEKFSINPVNGTGSLSVALPISPGRLGFGPMLALNYDSGSGNGIFGIGWRLATPSIMRRTDKGLPQYRDTEESDIFVLSEAEDLVPVLREGCDRNEFDEFEWDSYRIKRYRPRIEGLFALIERWTCLDTGEAHWRSLSKDNILNVYGLDANSRIADPQEPRHVFSWLISRSYDDKGNALLYDYVAENDRGIDLTKPSELNRIRTANRYLKRIRYGNRIPLLLDQEGPSFRRSHVEAHDVDSTQWMFEAVFDYGEGHYWEEEPDADGRILSSASAQTNRDWHLRQDPFSSYRSGFEVRTYRLCRRILMFHHFPDELGPESCLVRSTTFHYEERPFGSLIVRVVQSGHKRNNDGRYLTRSRPPLEFSYSRSPLEDPDFADYRLHDVDAESLANLPGGIDGNKYRFLDLDGEGISGVLTELNRSWLYKPNLGNGRLGAMETIETRPSLAALSAGRQQFMDLAGDGNLDLVDLSPPSPGFYERRRDAGWAAFRAFHSLPVRDWRDPNLRFVDLTGNGIADLLISEDDAFTWHPSLLQEGFGLAIRVSVPLEEGKGPHIIFADGTQSIYLADVSGDGLSDIVRIRNGEVCYWPNRGYGRFGAKVTMDRSPWFDEPDQFDQKRIRLADTDGSGTTDILYLSRNGVKIFLNETGNAWSGVRHLRQFPAIDDVVSISVTDFLGRGTACLLWSSPLPGDAKRQLRYVDLMCGQKPHLLLRTDNNLGAETRIHYASSTEFYLADKAAGTPWVTQLPFPVHVVARVETYDYVSRNRFVTRYTYHHGFYDGIEREFRGFGRVDQLDTEKLAGLTASGTYPVGDNIATASNVPPVLTKTWFHTGVYLQGGRISRHMAQEYYREGSLRSGETELSHEQIQASLLADTILPAHLTPEEAREACRSLKGSLLRQEVYALDDKEEASSRPYTVAESNMTIRLLQKQSTNRHAVFSSHAREAITFHYERTLYDIDGCRRADPRVSHNVTLAVDAYGNVLQSVAIGYGRRFPDPSPLLRDVDRQKQARILLTLTEADYTNAVRERDAYRTPLPAESRTYELLQVWPDAAQANVTNLFRFDELWAKVQAAGDGRHDIAYEHLDPTDLLPGHPYRRLIKRSRTLYRPNDLGALAGNTATLLPVGQVESRALAGNVYKLAFTPGLIVQVYRRNGTSLLPVPTNVLGSVDGGAGYIDLDHNGSWWIPSGRVYYHADPGASPEQELAEAQQHFFMPRRFVSPFGTATSIDQDRHDLLVVRSTDALGNRATAANDYRVLQPALLTDSNGNRSAVIFDTLGFVAGSAVMGKVTENLGDSLTGFAVDLTPQQIEDFFEAEGPHTLADALLHDATMRIVYDLDRFARTRAANPTDPTQWQPAYAATLARETHAADPLPPGGLKIQVGFSYSDGFGREIQKKVQCEPRPIIDGGPIVGSRWVSRGWTIFNNKGKPVRQYEPFFTDSHGFEFNIRIGESPVLCYDPVQRVVATLFPNHSWRKVVFDPWRQESWDVNDTILLDPKIDDDVKEYFLRLPDADYLPTWYAQRASGALGRKEQDAANKTAIHAATPAVAYSDSLGRTFLTTAHNRFVRNSTVLEEMYTTRSELDVEGNPREVLDANDRIVMRYDYDMLSTRIHQASMDAGERWILCDVTAKPIRAWDSRDHQFRTDYDELRRPTDTLLLEGDESERLIGRTMYGESQSHPELKNLRGKVAWILDQAGITTNEEYDFKGNLIRSQRQFAREYQAAIDWSAGPALDPETFRGMTTYDALNRLSSATSPDGSISRPTFNKSNLLQKVEVNLRGSSVATIFVANIDYDAKGRRIRIDYGNGTSTLYTYDPRSFRLARLLTQRNPVEFPTDCPDPPVAGWPGGQVQNLSYTYDPVGNITHIHDDAQQTVYFRNKRVQPSADYIYDAVYQLIEATGREHLGQNNVPVPQSYNDAPRIGIDWSANDGNAFGTYVERYAYDPVGNFLQIRHVRSDESVPGWSRRYIYNHVSLIEPGKTSNRLSSTTIGNSAPANEPYLYDVHGNLLRMPQLHIMQWDFGDRLQSTQRQAVNADDTEGVRHQGERTFYVYDAGGQRVRKVTERQAPAGHTPRRMRERVYLGGFEIYREYTADGTTVSLERETLHVMDDKQRIALVETCTKGNNASSPQLIRYQFGNHLGSAVLELDGQAQIISYEEYYPYGSTSYQAVRSQTETPKRYRYTGMERDEESGLNYHGARYYAPWLGRWTSPDPMGIKDGLNAFCCFYNNPVLFRDRNGRGSTPPQNFVEYATSVEQGLERIKQLGLAKGTEYGLAQDPKTNKLMVLRGGKTSTYFGKLIPLGHTHTGEDTSSGPSTADLNEFAKKNVKETWIYGAEDGWRRIRYDAQSNTFDVIATRVSPAGTKYAARYTIFENPDFKPKDSSPLERWRSSVDDFHGDFAVEPSMSGPKGGAGGEGSGGVGKWTRVGGAVLGAALGALFSYVTTGKVNAEDVALGAAMGAVPELGFVTAKGDDDLAVPGILYGISQLAPNAMLYTLPVAATGAAVGGVEYEAFGYIDSVKKSYAWGQEYLVGNATVDDLMKNHVDISVLPEKLRNEIWCKTLSAPENEYLCE